MIFGDQPVRLIGVAAQGVHHVGDLLAVAVVGAGDRIVVRHGDDPRPEIDEAEDHALRLHRDRVQPHSDAHSRLALPIAMSRAVCGLSGM